MALSCGIIGLPNVGKSTLFNALTSAQAATENFPFCTIEPNTGMTPVPDIRLDKIARIAESEKKIPATLRFVDVAGLVRGAAQGEGLGNQFLGHIRDTSAVIHVLRCFEDESVVRTEGDSGAEAELETIHLELMLADLEQLERILAAGKPRAQDNTREKKELRGRLEALRAPLQANTALRRADLDEETLALAHELNLITAKPMLYLANVSEDESGEEYPPAAEPVRQLAARDGAGFLTCSNRLEAELAQLPLAEREEMGREMGLGVSALGRIAQAAYSMLGQITFFTAGEKETRAWTLKDGGEAAEAAGVIHTDMERGFIRAHIITYKDYVAAGGEAGARNAGQLRMEGRNYRIQDGEIVHFHFNV